MRFMDRQIYNRTVSVDGVDIFYREAGDRNRPTLLLLHGFPSSSVMFKELMVVLADEYHLVAPDYPGFGFSDFPSPEDFEYSFDNISEVIYRFTEVTELDSFVIYLHDYGCPIGLRICMKSPERIKGIIIQDGNAYIEGIGRQWNETRDYWDNPTPHKKEKVAAFLSEEGVKAQYTSGLPNELMNTLSPEWWILDWDRMSRPGNVDMQFQLNCTFKSNLEMYPAFQQYFRSSKPQALIIWGKFDAFFDVEEASCFRRDLPDARVHVLDGGHKALQTNFGEVLMLVRDFMDSVSGRA